MLVRPDVLPDDLPHRAGPEGSWCQQPREGGLPLHEFCELSLQFGNKREQYGMKVKNAQTPFRDSASSPRTDLNVIIRVDVKIQSDHNCQCTLKVSSFMQMNYLKQQSMMVSHHILNYVYRIAVHLGMQTLQYIKKTKC